jgi:hypothetical protein
MLKIKDKEGKTKFVWKDDDEQPISIDELIIRESKEKKQPQEPQEKDNAN